jgi:DNA repair protein RadC
MSKPLALRDAGGGFQAAPEPRATTAAEAALLSAVLRSDFAVAERALLEAGSLKQLLRLSEDGRGPLSPGRARALLAAVELGRRAMVACSAPPRLRTAREVFEFLLPHLGGRREERFHVVGLDPRSAVLGDGCIAVGSVDSVQVDPREVFRRAVDWRASALIVGHCHPSGDAEPSHHDLSMTRQLASGATLLGLRLLDHVIVGDGCYVSLRDRGAIP